MLNSEDQHVVQAATALLHECVRRNTTRNESAVLDGDLPILRKLLILAYGFGKNSFISTSVESQITPEVRLLAKYIC